VPMMMMIFYKKKFVVIQYNNCNIFNNVDTNDKIQSKINICIAHSAMI
jgi:hypothetical protein